MARHALIVGIADYDLYPALPGARIDAGRADEVCRSLGFEVDLVSGRVAAEGLSAAVANFCRKVADSAAGSQPEPIALVACSGHGVQTAANDPAFPELLTSDSSPSADGGAVGFDVREHLVSRLNDVRASADGGLAVVLIFDCCRLNVGNSCWRSPAPLPSLRNDFYMIFACDPGRRARESRGGGKLMTHVLDLLPFAQPITAILEEAARRALRGGMVLQRPWVHYRLGVAIPVLGLQGGPLPVPSTSHAAADAARDDSLSDRAVVVLVGGTGHGKSTLGNAILGREAFAVSDGEESVTQRAAHGDELEGPWPLRVIDTVGFLDTGLSAGHHLQKFAEFLDLAPHGVDAFLLVMSAAGGRITSAHTGLFGAFREALGEDALAHTVLVFTFAGSGPMQRADNALQYCRGSGNAHLRGIAEKVQGVVAVDLGGAVGSSEESQAKVIREVQRMIMQNAARKYSNSALEAALHRRQELWALIAQLCGERRRLLESRAQSVDQGQVPCQAVYEEAFEALGAQHREEAQQAELERLPRAAKEHRCDWLLKPAHLLPLLLMLLLSLALPRCPSVRERPPQHARMPPEAQAGPSPVTSANESKVQEQAVRRAAEAEAAAAAASARATAEARTPEERRKRAREGFDGRAVSTDASGRLHKFKWVWDGTATDQATGVRAVSKHWKSQQGAKEHAREELFNVLFSNNMLG